MNDTIKTARWGKGVIFSPLHRLIYSWILCAPDWKGIEASIVDLFRGKRRRTIVMKDPSKITANEINHLSDKMNIPAAEILRIAREQLDPKITLKIANKTQQHVNRIPQFSSE